MNVCVCVCIIMNEIFSANGPMIKQCGGKTVASEQEGRGFQPQVQQPFPCGVSMLLFVRFLWELWLVDPASGLGILLYNLA